MGERDGRRGAIDNMTGRLVNSGMPADRARDIARTAMERLDRREDGRRDSRVPYPERQRRT